MQTESQSQSRAWLRTIPYSKIEYPDSTARLVRIGFWQAYMPLHYLLRNSLVAFNVFEHGKPKDFLGKIALHSSMREFVEFLVKRGYGNHFVSWKSKGEVVSLRYVENFANQYHIRIFKDGSVCGHYEYTPESHPFLHTKKFLFMKLGIKEIGIENRPEYFYGLLGDLIISDK